MRPASNCNVRGKSSIIASSLPHPLFVAGGALPNPPKRSLCSICNWSEASHGIRRKASMDSEELQVPYDADPRDSAQP